MVSTGLVLFAATLFTQTADFDANLAWGHLTKQVAFGPRKPGTTGHIQCRDWLTSELKKSCENVRLQELSHKWSADGKTYTMWNILGEQNWEKAKVRVLLLAHWDTRPTADMEQDDAKAAKPILGANDGASGVAVLLELARALKLQSHPDVGVMFLLTDGEDLGPGLDEMFLGARAFAKAIPTPRPEYGILLDMIGDKDLRIPIEPNSYAAAPDLVRNLYRHADKIGLGTTFPATLGPTIEDDHIPLIQAGLPTIDLIDFDYAPWHTLGDTVDKCSPASLGKVGRLLASWLRQPTPYRLSKSR
ncbi:MAG: M28 family peptidase [Fimbriimonas sp.]